MSLPILIWLIFLYVAFIIVNRVRLSCGEIKNYLLTLLASNSATYLNLYTIVFLFVLTLCLQDHLIHRFCPSHMSKHLWVNGPFLSLLQDSGSGTPSHQTPVTRNLFTTFSSKLKTHLFKLCLPRWILSHLIIGLPTRIWFLFFLHF